jgi:hypothetical protein
MATSTVAVLAAASASSRRDATVTGSRPRSASMSSTSIAIMASSSTNRTRRRAPGAGGSSGMKSILVRCEHRQIDHSHIQFTPGMITDEGEVTNESTAEFLRSYMAAFHQFIVRVYTALPRDA